MANAGSEAFSDRTAFAFKAGQGGARALGYAGAVLGSGTGFPTKPIGTRGWTKLVVMPDIRYGIDGPDEQPLIGLSGKNGLRISVVGGDPLLRSPNEATVAEAEVAPARLPPSSTPPSPLEVDQSTPPPPPPQEVVPPVGEFVVALHRPTAEAQLVEGAGERGQDPPPSPTLVPAAPVILAGPARQDAIPQAAAAAAADKLRRAMEARGVRLPPVPAPRPTAAIEPTRTPQQSSPLPTFDREADALLAAAENAELRGEQIRISSRPTRGQNPNPPSAPPAANTPTTGRDGQFTQDIRRFPAGNPDKYGATREFEDLREVLDPRTGHLGEILAITKAWRDSPPAEPDFDAIHRARLKAEVARMEVSESSILVRLLQRGEWKRRRNRLAGAERRFHGLRAVEKEWNGAQADRRRAEELTKTWAIDVEDTVGAWLDAEGLDGGGTLRHTLTDDICDVLLAGYRTCFDATGPNERTVRPPHAAPISMQIPLRRWAELRALLSSVAGPEIPRRTEQRMLRENVGPEQALRVRLAARRIDEALSIGLDLLMRSPGGRAIAHADAFADLARDPRTGEKFKAAVAARFLDSLRCGTGPSGKLPAERSDMMVWADVIHRSNPALGERMRAAAEDPFIPADEIRMLAAALSRVRAAAGDDGRTDALVRQNPARDAHTRPAPNEALEIAETALTQSGATAPRPLERGGSVDASRPASPLLPSEPRGQGVPKTVYEPRQRIRPATGTGRVAHPLDIDGPEAMFGPRRMAGGGGAAPQPGQGQPDRPFKPQRTIRSAVGRGSGDER